MFSGKETASQECHLVKEGLTLGNLPCIYAARQHPDQGYTALILSFRATAEERQAQLLLTTASKNNIHLEQQEMV